MFAAAMLYSTPALELSIYSTCKRISQKLMRNVTKFLALIYQELNTPVMPTLRCNMEEVILQGPDGVQDIRVVNSYPSQVNFYIFSFITPAASPLSWCAPSQKDQASVWPSGNSRSGTPPRPLAGLAAPRPPTAYQSCSYPPPPSLGD